MTSTSPESKLAAAKKDAGEDWILDFPESVAFEIPIEKKVSSNLLYSAAPSRARKSLSFGSPNVEAVFAPLRSSKESTIPSSIQMRLAGLADSPRNAFSLEDINRRIDEANKRKQEILDTDISKVAAHNAKAQAIFEKAKEQETEKLNSLEARINSKLSNAEAKKNEATTSWVQKLSQATIDKLQRGAKAKVDEEWSAKELETKIDIKSLKADLRREEMKLENQEKLAMVNQDKLSRGQLALSAAEDAAKLIDARIEQKVIAADHRREMNQILQSARLNECAASKKEKAVDALKQDEEQRHALLAEIEDKAKRAEERKARAIAEKIEAIAAQTKDKLRRGLDVGKLVDEKAKEKSEQITTKVEQANKRREDLIREQQEILKDLALKKERLVIERKKEEEKAIEVIGKMIRSKLHSANERKEGIIASKVESIKSGYDMKQIRAQETLQLSLAEAKELKSMSEKRLARATKKKNAILKAMVDERQDENRSKIDKVAQLNKIKDLEEIQRLIDIERKLVEANERREAQLLEMMPTKKVLPSPRGSTTSNIEEIENRINQANLRRESYLAEKVENASKKRKGSPTNRELFAASPTSDDAEDAKYEVRVNT